MSADYARDLAVSAFAVAALVAILWLVYEYKLWQYDECLQVGHTEAMCVARFWLSR